MSPLRTRIAAFAMIAGISLGACSTTTTVESDAGAEVTPASVAQVQRAGVVAVSPEAAAEVITEHAGDSAFTILDVRTPEEYAGGHVAGAVNIDFYGSSFADQIAALNPDSTYVLYCRSGNRSGQTAGLMRELGFAEVYDVSGGIVDWIAAGYPVE